MSRFFFDDDKVFGSHRVKVGDYSLKIHKSAYHLFSVFISKLGFLLCKRGNHSVRF